MKFIQEFKEFAIRGNVIDLSVAVVLGGAFGKITSALVEDIINPVIGLLIGGIDLGKASITLKAATETAPAVMINYESFLQTVINFVLIALAMFIVIKIINRIKREVEDAMDDSTKTTTQQATPSKPPVELRQEKLLEEIRDLLKS
jgi:large conductance mechanosensitive channel